MEELTDKQFGLYHLREKLGEGGMAVVYRAYQANMERDVALKILPRHLATTPEFTARFQREARVLARLQHPHILPVFDFGQVDGYTYLVMPFLQNGDLTDLLTERPLPLPHIRRIISQIGDALDYAHQQGLIHRDVKPTNVLLDARGNCLLSDFGLTKMIESSPALTSTGSVVGTPLYMSPEQGLGYRLDGRSDIYALGVMLYQMATGRLPYWADTSMAVLAKHINEPLPPPRQYNPALPAAVEKVIVTALAKQADDRYATAGEMVQAVQTAIPETVVGPLPAVTPPEQQAKTAPATGEQKRLPWLALVGLAIGLVILVALGSVTAFWLSRGASVPTPVGGQLTTPSATPGSGAILIVTPTTTPLSSPTGTPTPTAEPATATTTASPSPSATVLLGQDCPPVNGPFVGVWQTHRSRLGCPLAEAGVIPTIAEEEFEGGHLFWRSDTDAVYIVYDRRPNSGSLDEGQWLTNPAWKWDGSNPDGVGMSPPSGRVEPKRGFGWLWRTHLNGPTGRLGWALDREYGFDNLGQAQPFEAGKIFKGSGSRIYVLLDNGRFYAR